MSLGFDLSPHAGFIVGSYAFTALVIGGLIVRALRDNRAQKRALAAFGDGAGERS
ncbi:heme exporter protein CcmD [Methylobacterium sp. BTF04]|uniref:heme exporter protein CcmD n=1 Tax=Methylobacterium sp. BTF04 TaxID=2708300 RepID=UPI0013D1BBA3|nr:heme exporter protein CcmD [Methylobacterium sp. BTF04]NEU11197.1 heme exporter protein CcmD [Methylobacterium sp. BTF04]